MNGLPRILNESSGPHVDTARSAARATASLARIPRVVIVGAGFGGIEVARSLADLPCAVTLIDRKNHHCFQPLLYQVATASLSATDIAWPVRELFAGRYNVEVALEEVIGVDLDAKAVRCASGTRVPYDYLVIATGSIPFYFGHPEWEAYAPGLKTIEDALTLRTRLLNALERAERAEDCDKKSWLTFVVIGGGPTGVEMAGAIAEIARNLLRSEFRNIDPKHLKVVLIEAGPRILAPFPPPLSDYALRSLGAMGIEVRTGSAMTACSDESVTLSDGSFMATRCVIWAAGVQASPAADWLGVPRQRAGRVAVSDDLEVVARPNVFAVGDVAAAKSGTGFVPQLAPAAKQMGAHVGAVIASRLRIGKSPPRPFAYRHEGDLATIGRGAAIVSRGRLQLTGTLAWLFWGAAHIYFLIMRRSRWLVTLSWLFEYATSRRGARLIFSNFVGDARHAPISPKHSISAKEPSYAIDDARPLRYRPAQRSCDGDSSARTDGASDRAHG